ncbi:hypothetical protein [Thermoactinospora rubra]|uniref:hypothetical protein n=1 Tax=Thermoactinospora rubra TaxID=1088767 RepID=UPI000A117139|nr:hypothetical protein [Thermoactinospora rubra]
MPLHNSSEADDGLWERIEPLLPVIERRFRHPGRRRLDDRRQPQRRAPGSWKEGAIALLHRFRRLRIRWEIRDDILQAFTSSADDD